MRPLIIVLMVLLGLFLGCTGGREAVREDPKKAKLEAMLKDLEKEYAGFDDKIKATGQDMGLNNQMEEAKLLLKSRIERVKEGLKAYQH